jgi:hypothetical protein
MSAIVNGRSKYARKYPKGEKVYAFEDTLGIMVFRTKKSAEEFASSFNKWVEKPKLIIIRVKPIGMGKNISHISRKITTCDLDKFYSFNKPTLITEPPNNTMGYPGVLVID